MSDTKIYGGPVHAEARDLHHYVGQRVAFTWLYGRVYINDFLKGVEVSERLVSGDGTTEYFDLIFEVDGEDAAITLTGDEKVWVQSEDRSHKPAIVVQTHEKGIEYIG